MNKLITIYKRIRENPIKKHIIYSFIGLIFVKHSTRILNFIMGIFTSNLPRPIYESTFGPGMIAKTHYILFEIVPYILMVLIIVIFISEYFSLKNENNA